MTEKKSRDRSWYSGVPLYGVATTIESSRVVTSSAESGGERVTRVPRTTGTLVSKSSKVGKSRYE